jgi:hypothetical protein
VGRRRDGLAARHEPRADHGRHRDKRLRRAGGAALPGGARPVVLRGPGVPLGALGPRRRPRRQAGGGHRHRRLIQLVPEIQPVVGRLTLFQRTPPWIIPRLDFAYPEVGKQLLRRVPALQKLLRARQYWFREGNLLAFTGKSGRTASSMPTASSTGPT